MKFTYPDEILKELWATKDRIGARYKGNVQRFLEDLHKSQANSPFKLGSPGHPKAAHRPRSIRKTA